MTILYPQALWLLLLAIPIVHWARTSFSHLSSFQRVLSLVLRLVILVLLVLALAGIRFSRKADTLGVMFVVDVSDSIPADMAESALEQVAETIGSKSKDDLVGLVLVGRNGTMELFPSVAVARGQFTALDTVVERSFTNLADGLKLAASALPPGVQKRVVLISDGAENLGDVIGEANSAVESGVELVTIPLSPKFDDEAQVDMLYVPSSVGEGETAGLRMVFSSTRKQNARVLLLVDGEYFGESKVELNEGKNSFAYPVAGLKPGFHSISVAIEPEHDTTFENNRSFAFTRVAGRAGILIASDDANDTAALDATLDAYDIDAYRATSQSLPLSLPEWLSYDTVILSGVPAHRLSEPQMDQIASASHSFGHGLIMIGGESSFGPGGYYKTKIEEALPVTMDFKRHAVSPNMAIMLLVDSSGSMGITFNGYEKIALAREACINVVELSEPNDYYGVITFDSMPKWVVKPQKNLDRNGAIAQIRRIVAGGGTEIYPAMVAAEKALAEIDAKVKHVIILSDGITAPGDFGDISQKLVDGGATITTVGVGDDADLSFLQYIAEIGNGNSYFTNDPYDLPRIFTRETFMANKGTIVETEFVPLKTSDNALVEGIDWTNSPPLMGYVATSDKPTAESPLRAPTGDPVFSIWRYGLGRTAAFTSDAKNRWAAHWLSWDGYEKFWTSLVRATSATAESQGYRTRVDMDGDRGVVLMEVSNELGGSTELTQVEAHVSDPEMNQTVVTMRQIGVGKYEGEFPVADNGTYMVNVVASTPDGLAQASAGLAVSYSPEYKRLGADQFVLSQLKALSKPLELTGESLFKTDRIPQVQHNPAWELMVLVALYLWLLDIAVRRMMWSREYFGMAADSWDEYMERVRASRVRRGLIRDNISLGRLVERSRSVRSQIETGDNQDAAKTSIKSRDTAAIDGASETSAKADGSALNEHRIAWGRTTPESVKDTETSKDEAVKPADAPASYSIRARERVSKLADLHRKDEDKK